MSQTNSESKVAAYRVETPIFVAAVDTFNGRITKTAPILRWAANLPLTSLKEKLGRRFGFEAIKITKIHTGE